MSRRKRRPKRTNQATAQAPVLEAFGDLIDPTEYLTDVPGWGGQTVAAYLTSRDRGGNAPTFSTDQELANIRGAARIICDASVNAKCAMQNLGNYVIGQGFNYTVVDKDRIIKQGDQQSALANEARTIVEEFLTRTKYGTARRRKRMLWQQRRDGEVFVTLWHVGEGRVDYRVTDPGFFITPFDVRALDAQYPTPHGGPADWTFGIHTPDDDYEEHLGYFAQYSESAADFEYFTPDRMVHSRINVDDAIKRGVSDFYWVYTALSDAAKLIRNGVRGATVLSAIAGIVEHPAGTTEEHVSSFKKGSATGYYNETNRMGTRTNYTHKYNPGSLLHVPAGQSYKPSPLAAQGVAGSIIDIEQAVLRIIGSNWCMPEFMISADASNNNYASILVAGSPFVKFVEALQGDCAEEDEEVLWKVLGIANRAGRFARGMTMEQIKEALEIKVEAPQAGIEDKTQANAVHERLHRAGLLSDRTWATKAGLDYDQEVANGAKKPEPAAPFGSPQGDQQGGLFDPRDRDKDGIFPESFREDYQEEDHPRDDNGRWVNKDEITAAKTDPAKATELRGRVHDPEQRAKLDRAIGDGGGKPDWVKRKEQQKEWDEYRANNKFLFQATMFPKKQRKLWRQRLSDTAQHISEMPGWKMTHDSGVGSVYFLHVPTDTTLRISDHDPTYMKQAADIHVRPLKTPWLLDDTDNAKIDSYISERMRRPKITESRHARLAEAARLLWGDYPGEPGTVCVNEATT